ncbi:MAG: hypothetical protein KBD78_16095 [Oligoflexales bacterium]|nr:hypothetical protein [Oligoflexales bacterium]
MLSNNDINRIITACRAEFATKQELQEFKEEMRANFAAVLSIVDGMAKQISEMNSELKAHNAQLSRHERWHHQTAEKVNLKLEY